MSGLRSQPDRLPNAVQTFIHDPATDDRRVWRIRDLNDFLTTTGGGGPTLIQEDIAFDTPGLKDGILLATVPEGVLMLGSPAIVVMVETVWNGTTPQLNLAPTQAEAADGNITPVNITITSLDATSPGASGFRNAANQDPIYGGTAWAPTDLEIWAGVDDGFGGEAGATQGLLHFFLLYSPFA
jgi:hypothetical protein